MSGGTSGQGGIAAAPAPISADVGIVAAMSLEVGFLFDRLAKVRKYSGPKHTVVEGELGGKVVVLIVAGMGRSAARHGAQLLIDGHRPRVVFSAGFGGALDPGLERYDFFLADEVVDLEGQRFPVSADERDAGPKVHRGRLLTVDRIIRTAAEKAELRAQYEAGAVDMETSAVAGVCADRGVPFRAIRVISDDARGDLPREVVSMMTNSGSYRVGAALRAIWQRPSSLKDFWALHEHAQEAADKLAAFLVSAVERAG